MSPAEYDIAIVGAGPAGATLARLLAPGYRIILIDRRRLSEHEPEPRFRKTCGGLLAPDAQAMLARFGLGLPGDVLVEPQLFVVKTLDLATRQERTYQRFYFNLDRERFDRWLVSLVPETIVRAFSTHLVDLKRESDGYCLVLKDGNGSREIRAKVVVGADGARSKVRTRMAAGWPGSPREYLAIQEWLEADAPPPWFSVVFDPSITDFYGWTIPKGNAVLLGAALPPGADALATFRRLKDRLMDYGFQFGKVQRREGHIILRPRFLGRSPQTPNGVILIGEAGGFISPSSAEGFSYAFKSALTAAEALNEDLERAGAIFDHGTVGLRMQLRAKNLKSPFMYQPFLRRMVLATGLRHLPMVTAPQ